MTIKLIKEKGGFKGITDYKLFFFSNFKYLLFNNLNNETTFFSK